MMKTAEIIMDGIRKALEKKADTVEIPMVTAVKLVYVLPKLDELNKEIERVKVSCLEEKR